MKWLGFIALVLIESLAIFGLSLEQIGFTVPQAILISVYAALLVITITVFIIAHFVNLQKERENEFRILVEKLRVQEEAIKTVKEQVFRIGQNVLISEENSNLLQELFRSFYMWEMLRFFKCRNLYRRIDILVSFYERFTIIFCFTFYDINAVIN